MLKFVGNIQFIVILRIEKISTIYRKPNRRKKIKGCVKERERSVKEQTDKKNESFAISPN